MSLRILALVILIALGVGCESTPRDDRSEVMPTEIPQLVGNWEKTTSSLCSQVYPDVLQLQADGLYFGQSNTPGTFMQWDAGTYQVTDSTHINISTANDSIVTYEFAVTENILTFRDPNDCEFQYRKMQ